MKIEEALPQIVKRTYPTLEPAASIRLAASLLRFHQIDAIPIRLERGGQKKRIALFGYSCLSSLLMIDPSSYKSFLERPCEEVGLELSTLSADSELVALLNKFDNSRFGFAWVEGTTELGALVSLRDLLGLYQRGIVRTDLSINQVASSIFSMPSDTTLREALAEMFNRRFRRVFVGKSKDDGDDDGIITDRRIISYLFSDQVLEEVTKSQRDFLDIPIGELDKMKPKRIEGNPKLGEIAAELESEIEECLVCDSGLITPWDMIMKPWKMGRLEVMGA